MDWTFTMIMAGSGLPWAQIRSDWSSEALNHNCLLRLQLTLPTGLSCPAYKERGLKSNWKYSVWLQHLLLWYCSESQSEWREEAVSDLLVTSISVLLSLLPPCGGCVSAALEPSSAKLMLDMHGYPLSACQCALNSKGTPGGRQNWLLLVILNL